LVLKMMLLKYLELQFTRIKNFQVIKYLFDK
jgi:hypothetical protein